MKRGEIYWAATFEPSGRRPVVILTRTSAIPYLTSIVVASVTTNVREIPSEIDVGPKEGLRRRSAINCDNVLTLHRDRFDPLPVGELSPRKLADLDRALRYALGIRR